MRLPDPIRVQLTCSPTAGLQDLIVRLRVRSGTKNPYSILFPKTNEAGIAVLAAADFRGQYTDHWEQGLMDYNGTVEDADPVVEVSLYDPSWIRDHASVAMAWPLLSHERTKFNSRREAYTYLRWCRNDGFDAAPLEWNVERSPLVTYPVKARPSLAL